MINSNADARSVGFPKLRADQKLKQRVKFSTPPLMFGDFSFTWG
ncbi:hypothetical protein FDUTEX481_08438 [Tolypothrix sp. PCC 7601]|nr:hypothetical protein FDUTEX481_08438 [Tolypothrix sp. PCC 7601]